MANAVSGDISVIDNTSVVDTIFLGGIVIAFEFNPANGVMYAANEDSNTVTAIPLNLLVAS